jgi:hypothetical protein
MDSRNFSAKTKRLAWKRCAGHCEKCTCELTTGNVRYDHVIPWEISHDSSLGNCQVLCRKSCDHKKTYTEDIPTIAKVHRIYDWAIGIERSGPKLPGGRNSGIRKKLNGQVVKRVAPSEEYRRLIAQRYGGESS